MYEVKTDSGKTITRHGTCLHHKSDSAAEKKEKAERKRNKRQGA